MELAKIKGFGELLTAVRSKDADATKPDQELWEVMTAANKKAGRKIFSDQAVRLAKDSLSLAPNLSHAALARFILLVESSQANKREIAKAFQALDKVAAGAKSLKFTGNPFGDLHRLYSLITGELGFGATDDVGGTKTLTAQLAAGQLDKKGMTWLLVAIGRELGWPVSAAAYTPYAYLVKWAGQPLSLNFETDCSQGTQGSSQPYGNCTQTDESYISGFNLSRQSVQARSYLAPLTEVEMLGAVYSNLATVALSSDNCELACKDRVLQTTDRALAYHRSDIAALLARAVAWFPGENAAINQMNGATGNANGWNRMINIKKEMDKIARLDPNNFDIDLFAAKVYAYSFIDCRGAEAKLTQVQEKLGKVTAVRPEGRAGYLEQVQDLRRYLISVKQDCKEHIPDAQELKARAAWGHK